MAKCFRPAVIRPIDLVTLIVEHENVKALGIRPIFGVFDDNEHYWVCEKHLSMDVVVDPNTFFSERKRVHGFDAAEAIVRRNNPRVIITCVVPVSKERFCMACDNSARRAMRAKQGPAQDLDRPWANKPFFRR